MATGWNRPATDRPAARAGGAKKPSAVRGIIAGTAIALPVLGLCVYFVLGRGDSRPSTSDSSRSSRTIKEVKPTLVSKPQTNAVPQDGLTDQQREWKRKKHPKNPWGTPIPKELEYKPHWAYTYDDYCKIDPGYANRYAKQQERLAKVPWKTSADWDLANLLFAEPGKPGLAVPLDESFVKDFLKSMETPLYVAKDDSPEVAAKKRQLIEVKAYLKEQLDKGVDIVQLLKDEQKKNDRLRGLRNNLECELHKLEKTAQSTQEIDDYVAAANMMLEKEGVKGDLKLPQSLYRLKLERAESAAKGAAGETANGQQPTE